MQMRGNPEVKQIPWDTNDEWLQAWENGRTGCAPLGPHCNHPCQSNCLQLRQRALQCMLDLNLRPT